MVKLSTTANPQALSDCLLALATLNWRYDDSILSATTSREIAQTLQALGSIRFYDEALFTQLTGGLLHTISSSSSNPGHDLSKAFFSCGLSSHFSSSVNALAAWASQQDLQRWSALELTLTLSAWAMLTASTAGADAASLRTLADHLFAEASRRGAAAFKVLDDGEKHLGKLAAAHWEAQHMGLDGITDSELLRTAEKHTEERNALIGEQRSSLTSRVAAALKGHYEVQAALVHRYHVLLVSHPSCPRKIAIVVTQSTRDYLRFPALRLYVKAAMRLEQVKRCVDEVVLVDESELQQMRKKKHLRDLLMQRLDEVVGGNE